MRDLLFALSKQPKPNVLVNTESVWFALVRLYNAYRKLFTPLPTTTHYKSICANCAAWHEFDTHNQTHFGEQNRQNSPNIYAKHCAALKLGL